MFKKIPKLKAKHQTILVRFFVGSAGGDYKTNLKRK